MNLPYMLNNPANTQYASLLASINQSNTQQPYQPPRSQPHTSLNQPNTLSLNSPFKPPQKVPYFTDSEVEAAAKRLSLIKEQRDSAINVIQRALQCVQSRDFEACEMVLNQFLHQYQTENSPYIPVNYVLVNQMVNQLNNASNVTSPSPSNNGVKATKSAFRAVHDHHPTVLQTVTQSAEPVIQTVNQSPESVTEKRARSESEGDDESVDHSPSLPLDHSDESQSSDSEAAAAKRPKKRRDRGYLPCVMLTNISKEPIRVVEVHVEREFTMSKREAEALNPSQREELVKSYVRFLGNSLTDDLYIVAKDICLLIHTRKKNVAKSIARFNDKEKASCAVSCQRSDGTVSTHVLTVLSLDGVNRLLANSREEKVIASIRSWLFHQMKIFGHPRARMFDPQAVPTLPPVVEVP